MQFFNEFLGTLKDSISPLTLVVEEISCIAVCFFCLLNISLVFINFAEVELCFGVGIGIIVVVDV